MPGSKGIEKKYLKDMGVFDFTEHFDTDNLANPTGILKKFENKLADLYKSKNARFLTNGSSGGIFASILYASRRSKKILVDRNVHISVVNICNVLDMQMVFVNRVYIAQKEIFGGIDIEDFKKKFDQSFGAVIITSPDYNGICSDVQAIADATHKLNSILIVDSAHGAHFAFSTLLPTPPNQLGADITIYGLHKTLPALTQSAVVVYDNLDGFAECVQTFRTTSPSYILMTYADLAISKPIPYEKIIKYRKYLKNLLGKEIIGQYGVVDIDLSRIVIFVNNGHKVLKELYKKGILLECASHNTVVAIASKGNKKEHFVMLAKEISKLKYKKIPPSIDGEIKYPPYGQGTIV